MKFAIALIAAVCVVSTAAAPVRQRTETQYKSSLVKSDEKYDPYMGIGGQRELEGCMSMAEGSMHTEDEVMMMDITHSDGDGHDHDDEEKSVEEVEESDDSSDDSSG